MSNESRERDRISFQEVAKLATTPAPSAESPDDWKENSGIIDFAALAASEADAKRTRAPEVGQPPPSVAPSPVRTNEPVAGEIALPPVPPPTPTTPMLLGVEATTPRPQPPARFMPTMTLPFGATSQTLPGVGHPAKSALPKPAPVAARLPPVHAPRVPGAAMRTPSIAAAASPVALPHPSTLSPATLSPETARPTAMAANPDRTGGASAVWIALGAGMGLGALLTTVFFQTRGADSTRPALATAMLQSAPVRTATIPGSGGTPAPSPGPESASDKPVAGAAATHGDPTDRPAPPEQPSAVEVVAKHAEPSGAVRGAAPSSAALTPAIAAAPAANGPSKPSPPAVSDQSLEALMKKAVGIGAQPAASPPTSPLSAVPSSPPPAGDVPLKPAMGAVQGAVGTVLPATRYCLGPDDAISHATITFKSDGSAQNVAVSGPAAGQPAEACIRARLMTARVPPFSSPTFTWTVTVRPAS